MSALGEVIASLKGGRITVPSENALWAGPLGDFLEPARSQLYRDALTRLAADQWDPEGPDDDYPRRSYTFFLERLLFHARLRTHGGTIIMVPTHLLKEDTRLTDRVNIKYSCGYDFAWELLVRSLVNHRRFYDLHFPLWDAKQPYTQALFKSTPGLRTKSRRLTDHSLMSRRRWRR